MADLAQRLAETAARSVRAADDFGRDTWDSTPDDERPHFTAMGDTE